MRLREQRFAEIIHALLAHFVKVKPIGVVVFVQRQREIETPTGENFFQRTYRRVAVAVEHAVEVGAVRGFAAVVDESPRV